MAVFLPYLQSWRLSVSHSDNSIWFGLILIYSSVFALLRPTATVSHAYLGTPPPSLDEGYGTWNENQIGKKNNFHNHTVCL